MSFSLPFVSLQRLDEGVELMRAEFSTSGDLQLQEWCNSFVNNYIVGFWIEGPHPPETWNVAEDSEQDLTNNAAEGGNFRLSARLGKHPNWWDFICKIKSEFQTAECKLTQAEQGLLSIKYSKRTEQVIKTRKKLKELLADGTIDLRRFMRACGACGAKSVSKGQIVHNSADELVRSTLSSVSENNREIEVPSQVGAATARQRQRRQCPRCNGEYSASYYYIHRSRYCTGEEGRRGGRGRGHGRGRGRGLHSQDLNRRDVPEPEEEELEVQDFVSDVTFENIIQEVNELDVSVFSDVPETEENWELLGARPRTTRIRRRESSQDNDSPPRTRLRTRENLGPSSRTRSSTQN